MTIVAIRAALETALAGMTPALSCAYENVAFSPVAGVPYQRPYVMAAPPANPTMGDGYYRDQGIFQVTLMYPIQGGSAPAAARADMIRALFRRGASFSSGGLTVKIMTTPVINAAQIDADRWALPVRVTYSAEVFN